MKHRPQTATLPNESAAATDQLTEGHATRQKFDPVAWIHLIDQAVAGKESFSLTAADAEKARVYLRERLPETAFVKQRQSFIAQKLGWDGNDFRALRNFLLKMEQLGLMRRRKATGYGQVVELTMTSLASSNNRRAELPQKPARAGAQNRLFSSSSTTTTTLEEELGVSARAGLVEPPSASVPAQIAPVSHPQAIVQPPQTAEPAQIAPAIAPTIDSVRADLKRLKVPAASLDMFIANHSPAVLAQAIAVADQQKGGVQKIVTYLTKAIKMNWQPDVAAPKPPVSHGPNRHQQSQLAIGRQHEQQWLWSVKQTRQRLRKMDPSERERWLVDAITLFDEALSRLSLGTHVELIRNAGDDPFESDKVIVAIADAMRTREGGATCWE